MKKLKINKRGVGGLFWLSRIKRHTIKKWSKSPTGQYARYISGYSKFSKVLFMNVTDSFCIKLVFLQTPFFIIAQRIIWISFISWITSDLGLFHLFLLFVDICSKWSLRLFNYILLDEEFKIPILPIRIIVPNHCPCLSV